MQVAAIHITEIAWVAEKVKTPSNFSRYYGMLFRTIESKIMMIVQGSECLGDTEEVTTDGTGEITQRMGIVQHVPQPSNYEVRKGLYFSFTNHSRQL